MKKVYFVSYSYTRSNKDFGFGNIDITLEKPIKTINDVKEIQEYIRINFNFKTLIILNYIELEHST